MLRLELRRNSRRNNAVETISRTYENCPVSITKPLLYQLSYASMCLLTLLLQRLMEIFYCACFFSFKHLCCICAVCLIIADFGGGVNSFRTIKILVAYFQEAGRCNTISSIFIISSNWHVCKCFGFTFL